MQNIPDSNINIEEYYNRYAPMVLRRCRQLLRDEEKAKDALQEVFVRLLKHQDRLKDQYPSSLLFRISTNTCLNMIRDVRAHPSVSLSEILPGIAIHDKSEDRAMFRDVLDRLFRKEKSSTRDIVVMYFVDGMTLQEVATEVGLSLSGVRKRIREFSKRAKTKKEIYYDQ